jgi:hypothetical protein
VIFHRYVNLPEGTIGRNHVDVIELGQDIAKGTDLGHQTWQWTVYYNDFPIEHPFYIGFFHGFSIMFDF